MFMAITGLFLATATGLIVGTVLLGLVSPGVFLIDWLAEKLGV